MRLILSAPAQEVREQIHIPPQAGLSEDVSWRICFLERGLLAMCMGLEPCVFAYAADGVETRERGLYIPQGRL